MVAIATTDRARSQASCSTRIGICRRATFWIKRLKRHFWQRPPPLQRHHALHPALHQPPIPPQRGPCLSPFVQRQRAELGWGWRKGEVRLVGEDGHLALEPALGSSLDRPSRHVLKGDLIGLRAGIYDGFADVASGKHHEELGGLLKRRHGTGLGLGTRRNFIDQPRQDRSFVRGKRPAQGRGPTRRLLWPQGALQLGERRRQG